MAAPEMPVERLEPWTFDDLLELPESPWRFEIVDGGLIMSPPPGVWHEGVSDAVRTALRNRLPSAYRALGPLAVDMHPTYLVPDLAVLRAEDVRRRKNRLRPAEVLLVVEVVSPGSVSSDRILKPAKYAAAGIPAYWRIETEPETSLTAYQLTPGSSVYTTVGTWRVGQTAHLTEPFEMDIPIADLET
ncbi:Uma2 family endonuclease [Phytoactinopolyspora halotolerans]|uniref:Uma2 family endonuclease n=1 Tax=Phytoactinopolyspora halotolerans TaxID=1981512 RepID=A0A6L9S8M8_9ACTN|nr:Uma2 family endonuclease [Phytoactinopolyspora halotolerans]NEE00942.1 Uma2 family endonuclease [Phytoactinopolyspora halotolerans]